MDAIPEKPYPELRSVLERFVAGVHVALQRSFIGAYLVGSLATGDFDLDSDVDFLVITNDELSDAEVQALQTMHVQIHGLGCYPAEHLEGSYISKDSLNRADLVGVQTFWYVENGSTALERSVHDNQWHVRWVLRERAIVLDGPDPKTLLPAVPTEVLHTEIVAAIQKLSAYFAAEIGKPLAYFNTRFGQSFAVLTCCRMLHTLQCEEIQSKHAGVERALQSLEPRWHELIRQAWSERSGVRFGEKIGQPAEAKLLRETEDFLTYAQNQDVVLQAGKRTE